MIERGKEGAPQPEVPAGAIDVWVEYLCPVTGVVQRGAYTKVIQNMRAIRVTEGLYGLMITCPCGIEHPISPIV